MTKSKTPAAHPGFTNMISAAIVALNSRTGWAAIHKYIVANSKVEPANYAFNVRISLKRKIASGALKMAKAFGNGAGWYKVDKVDKPKVKKAKKPKAKKAAKKPVAKKAAKKPAAKKPTAKKAAPKKRKSCWHKITLDLKNKPIDLFQGHPINTL